MKFLTTTSLAAVMVAATAFGQTAKPSPYEGVSHPPDEAIVTNDLSPTNTTPTYTNSAPANSTVPATVTPPAAHVEAAPTSPQDHTYVQHPGLVTRPASPTDADVVTSVFPPPPADDSDVVTSVPSAKNQLPTGTILTVALNQQLSTSTTQPGAIFRAHLIQPVMKNGSIIIPVGSILVGRVTSVYEGRRITGGASIRLRPDEVNLPDGKRYFLHAEVYDLGDPSNAKPDSEGNVVNVAHGKRAVAEAGLFGGGAAAAGFMLAGGPAALIAGGAAAGYVGTRWLLQSKQAVLQKDSTVIFGLTQPMSLIAFHE